MSGYSASFSGRPTDEWRPTFVQDEALYGELSPGSMRRLPWHVAVRADRKAVLTALGIALGVAFALISFAVPSALRTATVPADGPFAREDGLVMDAALAQFDARLLKGYNTTLVLVSNATLQDGTVVTFASIEGANAPVLPENEVEPGPLAPPLFGLVHLAGRDLVVGPMLDRPEVDRSWVIADPYVVRALSPTVPASNVSYALVHGLPPAGAQRLRAEGLTVTFVPGVQPFFEASAVEITNDLALVVAFCSILVTLFTYEFLSSEVREKRPEIGLWRSLGMHGRDVFALILARAGAIVVAGMAVGSLLAYLVLLIAARATNSAIFAAHFDASTLGAVGGVFLASGLLGGVVPALSAARTTVREQLEAVAK